MTDSVASTRRGALSVSMWILFLVLLSTPFWYYRGATGGSYLLGEPPSPERMATSDRYLLIALVVGFGVPLIGLAIATVLRDRAMIVLYLMAPLQTLVICGGGAGMQRPLHDLRDKILPAEPPTSPAPVDDRPSRCRVYSGGDNDCPGG